MRQDDRPFWQEVREELSPRRNPIGWACILAILGMFCLVGYFDHPAELHMRPAIIVSGLRHDNGELGAFLDLIQMGGASIPVRSMVTPTSKGWTLANLLLELNTEHETVQGGNA